MNKIGTAFEILYFVMGGLLLFIGVDVTVESGLGDSWYYFALGLLSLLMYLRRRKMRLSDK